MNHSAGTAPTTIVAILSSNYLLRLGLKKIVEAEPWITLIEDPTSGSNVEGLTTGERPYVAVIDTESTPDLSETIRLVRTAVPGIRIIILSGLHDPCSTKEAMDQGVDGIVLKMQPSAVLVATIAYLANKGRSVLSTARPAPSSPAPAPLPNTSSLATPTIPLTRQAYPSKWPDGLTERERGIITLISQGLSNKDIADRLSISNITVRHHLTNIFDKLGVSNRQKLLIRAHEYGIVHLTAQA